MKNFHYRVLRSYESSKFETWYTHGQWVLYCVYQNQSQGPITLGVTSLDRFYKFPLVKIFCHTFLKNCKGNKVETLHPLTSYPSKRQIGCHSINCFFFFLGFHVTNQPFHIISSNVLCLPAHSQGWLYIMA